jgi:ABC-type uncharacterized transport system substrate-binding protein
MNLRRHIFAGIAILLTTCSSALAHPHVWVVMRSQIAYDKAGLVIGIRHSWMFDDVYSSFVLQGLKGKKRGVFSRAELAPLVQENLESLKDVEYFTQMAINGNKAIFGDPVESWFEYENGKLTFHFMLPLKSPVKIETLELAIYDPLYYIDFTFAEKDAAVLPRAPASCKLTISKGQDLVMNPGQSVGDAYYNQVEAKGYGWQFANIVHVKCP